MKNLIIESTKSTPRVEFLMVGKLKMEGRSLPENAIHFYQPLFDWVREYREPDVIIDFNLEYFNTSSSKQILTLLQLIANNPLITNIKVNWYYEEGDMDSLEAGEHYSEILKLPFNFIEYEESRI
jgi:hypothetical protein